MRHSQGHRCSISHKSMSSQLTDTNELTDFELVKQVNDMKHQVKMLSLENEIFEKTIMRLEPALMRGVQHALEHAVRFYKCTQDNSFSTIESFTKSEQGSSCSRRLNNLTAPSRVQVGAKRLQSLANLGATVGSGTGFRINVLGRSELVYQEIEFLTQYNEKIKKNAAKEHAILKAKLEEIGIRVADVTKAVADFKQEVIVEGRDKINQRIPAEIWIRFMTEWVKAIDKQIDKLHLRTTTLNTQYIKLLEQSCVKTELSESLQPIDFDILKIENTKQKTMIEQKSEIIKELKQMRGDANLSVTSHQKALKAQKNHLMKVNDTLRNRKEQTVHMNKEREIIEVQADALAQELCEIQKLRKTYEVPDVMDYVEVKSELADLRPSVKLLENRLHIAQTALSSITKKLNCINLRRKKEVKKI